MTVETAALVGSAAAKRPFTSDTIANGEPGPVPATLGTAKPPMPAAAPVASCELTRPALVSATKRVWPRNGATPAGLRKAGLTRCANPGVLTLEARFVWR